jgi:hypothetical protein
VWSGGGIDIPATNLSYLLPLVTSQVDGVAVAGIATRISDKRVSRRRTRMLRSPASLLLWRRLSRFSTLRLIKP